MKKLILCIIVTVCLLSACAARDLPITENLDERIKEAIDIPFVRADEDFGKTNFDDLSGVKSWRIYLSEKNDGTEYGYFVMESKEDAARMQEQIRAYLDTECEQVRSLAALYPAEDLEA